MKIKSFLIGFLNFLIFTAISLFLFVYSFANERDLNSLYQNLKLACEYDRNFSVNLKDFIKVEMRDVILSCKDLNQNFSENLIIKILDAIYYNNYSCFLDKCIKQNKIQALLSFQTYEFLCSILLYILIFLILLNILLLMLLEQKIKFVFHFSLNLLFIALSFLIFNFIDFNKFISIPIQMDINQIINYFLFSAIEISKIFLIVSLIGIASYFLITRKIKKIGPARN